MDCLLYDFRLDETTKTFFGIYKPDQFLFSIFCLLILTFLWMCVDYLFNHYKKRHININYLILIGGTTLFFFVSNLFSIYNKKNRYDELEHFYITQYFNVAKGKVSNCRYYERESMNKLSKTQIVFEINGEEFIITKNSFGEKKYKELSVIQNGMKIKICHLGGFIFTIEHLDCKK